MSLPLQWANPADIAYMTTPLPTIAPATPEQAAASDAVLAHITTGLIETYVLTEPLGFAPAGTVFRSLPR